MELLVLLVVMVFWAVCLLVTAAAYGSIFLDLFKYLVSRKELRRRVVIGVGLFGLILAGVWLWNYTASMYLFLVPFLIAPPVRLAMLLKQHFKQKLVGKDIAKAVALGVVSFCCLAVVGLVIWVLFDPGAVQKYQLLPSGNGNFDINTDSNQGQVTN